MIPTNQCNIIITTMSHISVWEIHLAQTVHPIFLVPVYALTQVLKTLDVFIVCTQMRSLMLWAETKPYNMHWQSTGDQDNEFTACSTTVMWSAHCGCHPVNSISTRRPRQRLIYCTRVVCTKLGYTCTIYDFESKEVEGQLPYDNVCASLPAVEVELHALL